MIAFGPDVVRSFEQASAREWLETNGRGSYAMGTVAGANTRRTHSLLTTATVPPGRRVQLVNRLEDALVLPGGRHPLSCQTYPDAVHPDGFSRLQEFRLDPFPVWIYEAGGVRFKKSLFMRYGEDTVAVLYEHLAGPEAQLEVRPLFSGRPHNGVGREDDRFKGRVRPLPGAVEAAPNGVPAARVAMSGGTFVEEPLWYRSQAYGRDADGTQEDVFGPGILRAPLLSGGWVAVACSRESVDPAEIPAWAAQERRQRLSLLDVSPLKGVLGKYLSLVADQFLVSRAGSDGVAAGYPRMEDGERDAVASVPGLLLATGRREEAEKAIDGWVGRLEAAAPPLETGLWLVWAAQKVVKAAKNAEAARRWAPALRGLVDAVEKGDRRGVHMDRDGLVFLPEEGGAAKPLEIQALWYNALEFLAELDLKLKEKPRGYDKLAAIARASFNEKFWNAREEYPFARLEGREKDASITAGALWAIGLPYEILDAARFEAVVSRAQRELWTSRGLRPRPSSDTVHPWMLGPFLSAHAKAHGSSDDTKARQAELLRPFRDVVMDQGAGALPWSFQAGTPSGCPVSARTVAEILRILWEESIPL